MSKASKVFDTTALTPWMSATCSPRRHPTSLKKKDWPENSLVEENQDVFGSESRATLVYLHASRVMEIQDQIFFSEEPMLMDKASLIDPSSQNWTAILEKEIPQEMINDL
ncbi:hypothetical protein AVEN_18924-1 [Araneus ventricosus]|uniref:Uncharacterized protein n=1 Tax=Araneus ventricosus TaxID=182803 RepID=A0A4Y2MBP8_ARAVE|nr:hypothetical protein AVEN_18924-1 [Araneus ventricosus]